MTYFNLKLEDAIASTTAQDQLDVDFQTGGNNPNVVRIGAAVQSISAGYQNAVVPVERNGIDLTVNGMVETKYGSFLIGGDIAHYLNYDEELSYGTGNLYNAAGTLGFTKWRANALIRWSMDDYFASLSWNYIGSSESNESGEQYPQWDVFNARVGYDLGERGTVGLTVRNLLDRNPLLDDGSMVNEYIYDLSGRVVTLTYSVEM